MIRIKEGRREPGTNLDCVSHDCAQGSQPLYPNLATNTAAACDYDFPLLCHFRQPDWRKNRLDGWLSIYGFYCARPDLDVSDHQLLRQRFIFFFSSKFQRSIEEIQVSPTPNAVILLGFMTGGMVRGLMVGAVVTLVSMVFSDLRVHSVVISLTIIVLTAMLFALGGFLNGLFARKFDDVSIVPTFILTPLTYLGGIFYSINLLPAFWQGVSHANPILYMINGFRHGFLGVSDISLPLSYCLIILFSATLFTINLRLLNRGYGIRQ